jgi:hypothetical protein
VAVFEDDEIGIDPTVCGASVAQGGGLPITLTLPSLSSSPVNGTMQAGSAWNVTLPRVLDRNFQAIIRALRRLRDAIGEPPVVQIHRGVTLAQITKGSTGNVGRYTAGTNTASGTTDSVIADHHTVGITKRITYLELGGNFYMISAEKTELEVVLDISHTTGETQIKASTVTTQLDTVASPALENKITVNPCPP